MKNWVSLLSRKKPKATDLETLLAAFRKNDDEAVKVAKALAHKYIGDSRVEEIFRQALQDFRTPKEILKYVIKSMPQWAGKEDIKMLIVKLGAKADPQLYAPGFKVMAAMGDDSCQSFLLGLLNPNFELFAKVVEALGACGNTLALKPLRSCAKECEKKYQRAQINKAITLIQARGKEFEGGVSLGFPHAGGLSITTETGGLTIITNEADSLN